jgi:hypothetical protein
MAELIAATIRDQAPALLTSVPEPLAKLVTSCLAKTPADRIASASELAALGRRQEAVHDGSAGWSAREGA